jgi:hypothetical protein
MRVGGRLHRRGGLREAGLPKRAIVTTLRDSARALLLREREAAQH